MPRLLLLLATLLLAGCAALVPPPGEGWQALAPGLDWREQRSAERLVQLLRVDLWRARLRLSPEAAKGQPLDALARAEPAARASVNASFFDKDFRPRGLTVSDGRPWAEPQPGRRAADPLLACDAARHCAIVFEPPATPDPAWQLAVSGTPWLVRDGRARSAADDAGCASLCARAHPRTALGLDASGRWLYIVLAAGRRDAVAGLSLAELAELLRSLGVRQGFNLDGGGSSALVVDGEQRLPRPFNEPLLRRIANALHIES